MNVSEVYPASRKTEGSTRFYTCDDAGNWSAITSGDDKSFGMRSARKMLEEGKVVVPSVTSVMSVLAKPGLLRWQFEQVAKAAWDTDTHGLTEEQFIEQCVEIAGNASKGAMDLGSAIHQAIEDCIAGKDYDADLAIYVVPVMAKRAELGIRWSEVEQCVGSAKYGYAGRCDDNSADTFTVRDYKSRKSKNGKVSTYETDFLQLAAYMFALWGNEAFKRGSAEVWGISTSEPGVLTVTTKTGPELIEDFQCFLSLCNVWAHMNNFDPRVKQ